MADPAEPGTVTEEADRLPVNQLSLQSDNQATGGSSMAPVAHSSSESQSAEASSEPQRPAPLPPVDAPPKRPRTAQPTRSILKPPPPPPKPTISNKLRDVLGSINPKFFDAQVIVEPPAAWGGRLGRFVGGVTQAVPVPSVNSDPGPSTAPTQPLAPQRTGKPLKRATFMLPALTITYPISSSTPPWSGKVVEDRKSIETTYRELLLSHAGAEYWTAERLVQLYELACKGREERPKPVIRKALKTAAPPPPGPRHLHLLMLPPPVATSSMLLPPAPTPPSPSHHFLDQPLTRHTAEALADVLTVEWGLSKLSFENGVFETDDALKPILHALLISGTLSSLGLAGNRKLRPSAWRLVSLFLRRAQSLRYLDLSDNVLDKRSMEYLVQAFASSEPDKEVPVEPENMRENLGPSAPLLKDRGLAGPATAMQTLRLDNCNLKAPTLETLAHGIRHSDLKNISLRRNRISNLGAVALALMIRDYPDSAVAHSASIPLVVSSSAGGVTTRTVPEGYGSPQWGGSALQRSVRALDGVERLGNLLTLDLKGNEIRNGVSYIAQVLKRNRTLKVLNLAENRIDVGGLVALAEALKYNSTLETLDLGSNPCSGPSLEGVAALRTAFTVNASLKRLFLSDTQLSTEGAIALAEFLPESKTLLHFDLTENPSVETAGIMALAVGLKANTLLRCLDLSIPPNNPELAELSQSILQSCVRNTELAAARAAAPEAVWAPIKKSALVRQVRQADDARAEREREQEATSPEGVARERVYTLRPERVVQVSEETVRDLQRYYTASTQAELPSEPFVLLIETAKALRERIVEQVENTSDSETLASLLELNDALALQIDRRDSYTPPPRIMLPSEIAAVPSPPRRQPVRRHLRIPSVEISSPNFSLGDSDVESDPEELAVVDVVEETSRRMVEEEGEIFRKGVKLGVGVDVDDKETETGEQLRQEILDTPVARSPTRRVIPLEAEEEALPAREGDGDEEDAQ